MYRNEENAFVLSPFQKNTAKYTYSYRENAETPVLSGTEQIKMIIVT